jgi:hypothetical protein
VIPPADVLEDVLFYGRILTEEFHGCPNEGVNSEGANMTINIRVSTRAVPRVVVAVIIGMIAEHATAQTVQGMLRRAAGNQAVSSNP